MEALHETAPLEDDPARHARLPGRELAARELPMDGVRVHAPYAEGRTAGRREHRHQRNQRGADGPLGDNAHVCSDVPLVQLELLGRDTILDQ
jgi:hypothetical protein